MARPRFKNNPEGTFTPPRAQQPQQAPPPDKPAEESESSLRELVGSLVEKLATAAGISHQSAGSAPSFEKENTESFLDEALALEHEQLTRDGIAATTRLSQVIQGLSNKIGATTAPSELAGDVPQEAYEVGLKPPTASTPPREPIGPSGVETLVPVPPPLPVADVGPPERLPLAEPPPTPTPPPAPPVLPVPVPVVAPVQYPQPQTPLTGTGPTVADVQDSLINTPDVSSNLGPVTQADLTDKTFEEGSSDPSSKADKAADLSEQLARLSSGDTEKMTQTLEDIKKMLSEKFAGLELVGEELTQTFKASTVGGIVAGVGGVGQFAGALSGGLLGGFLGSVLGKGGMFVSWLGTGTDRLRDFVQQMEATNLQFGEFSASMAAVAAYSELLAILRSQARGERLAPSAIKLTEARDKFERALNPLEDKWMEFRNVIMAEVLDKLADVVGVAAEIYKWISGEDLEANEGVIQKGTGRELFEFGEDKWEDFGRPPRFPNV